MNGQRFFAFSMIVIVVSFLGFCVENIWLSLTKGYMDNRGMTFPFLVGYGIAIAAIYILFGTPKSTKLFGVKLNIENTALKYIAYFLILMVCISLGEILLGKFVEKSCGFSWWDYSKLPLHITQYTSVPTSFAFSSLIFIFMDKFFSHLYKFFISWDPKVLRVTASILLVILISDYIHSACIMRTQHSPQSRWKINMSGSKLYRVLHGKEL